MKFIKTWNFFIHSAKSNHRSNSILNGIDFLTALELSRKCTSLVGHMRSAVSIMLLRIMCYKHHNSTGHCPIFYDFSYPSWTSGPWEKYA